MSPAPTPEEDIANYIRRFARPPADEIEVFIAGGRRRLLHKGAVFTEVGEAAPALGFLHSGIARYSVLVAETGEDVTKDFSVAPNFIVSFGSLVRGEPARVAVSAVEDCVVTSWPGRTLLDLYERHAEWQKLGRKAAEWLYVRKEDRELAFLLRSPEERYDALAAEFAAVVDRIPQHFLASYVGIAPESLSRLKRRRNAR
jgi:CRP-like cAMP-binding protein